MKGGDGMGSRRTSGGTRHLVFIKLPLEKGRKLFKYNVVNEKFNEVIGVVHWRGGWRQYVFQAGIRIDMSRSCHKEIDKFIDNLMDARKK